MLFKIENGSFGRSTPFDEFSVELDIPDRQRHTLAVSFSGSRFRVQLDEMELFEVEDDFEVSTHSDSSCMKVFLVEDEVRMAKQLRKGLERGRLFRAVAYDGEAGLELARTVEHDLMILDWMLPKLDGAEVARRLRRAKIQTPILILTARDAPVDVVEGLDCGADDYLIKPFAASFRTAKQVESHRNCSYSLTRTSRDDVSRELIAEQHEARHHDHGVRCVCAVDERAAPPPDAEREQIKPNAAN